MQSKLQASSRRGSKTAARSAMSPIETLESRQLMSVASPIAVSGTTRPIGPVGPIPGVVATSTKTPLVVSGTFGNDHLRLDSRNGIISVIRENVVVSTHFAADVSSIDARLSTGDDSFTLSGTFPAGIAVTITAGSGNDVIVGSNLSDKIFGNDGNDTINAGPGNDTVFGDSGNDNITGGGGVDMIDGGFGDDTLSISDGTAHGGFGNDTIRGGTAFFARNDLFGDAGNDKIGAGPNGRTFIYGGDGADNLIGSLGEDELYGEGGDDTLTGGKGHDRLFGGDGNDRIFAHNDGSRDGISGGAGFDTADVDDRSFFLAFFEVQDSWSTVERVIKH